MSTTKITPKICESGKYTGYVTMRHPSFDDRISFYEDMGIDIEQMMSGDGEAVASVIKKNGFKFMRVMARRLKEFVTEVAITRVIDNYSFNSLEALESDSQMHTVIMELSFKLMGEFKAAGSTQA